ncbi:hypothetical protein L208DRAFT_1393506 [Tricholoma matsutake]|nr:hypothetical protein L208DRAFT_1393506 [Tricholoma matsutake 945]
MPSHRSASASSDDEEEPPESLSLYDSRRDIEKRADTLKQFQAAEKEKKRARNRERDRRLKEQAQHSRKRRKAPYESGGDLEVRMTRAMEEAEAELDGHGGHDTEQREDGEEIESDQASTGSDDEEESDAEHEAELHIHSTGEVEVNKPQVSKTPHHLPEHLFASAFSSQAVQSTSPLGKRKAAEETSKRLVKKRARNAGAPKDTVVGSRTIRTLVRDQHPSGAGTIPSSKVKKFIDRTLALKGGNPKTRGWERRAANIGSMRNNGPAANFVRNR